MGLCRLLAGDGVSVELLRVLVRADQLRTHAAEALQAGLRAGEGAANAASDLGLVVAVVRDDRRQRLRDGLSVVRLYAICRHAGARPRRDKTGVVVKSCHGYRLLDTRFCSDVLSGVWNGSIQLYGSVYSKSF